jgi:hypothetical protein
LGRHETANTSLSATCLAFISSIVVGGMVVQLKGKGRIVLAHFIASLLVSCAASTYTLPENKSANCNNKEHAKSRSVQYICCKRPILSRTGLSERELFSRVSDSGSSSWLDIGFESGDWERPLTLRKERGRLAKRDREQLAGLHGDIRSPHRKIFIAPGCTTRQKFSHKTFGI